MHRPADEQSEPGSRNTLDCPVPPLLPQKGLHGWETSSYYFFLPPQQWMPMTSELGYDEAQLFGFTAPRAALDLCSPPQREDEQVIWTQASAPPPRAGDLGALGPNWVLKEKEPCSPLSHL